MTARVAILIVGTLLAWLVAFGVASLTSEADLALTYSLTAMGICLVPAIVTLVFAEATAVRKPAALGIAFLAGTLVRMLVVFVAGVGLLQVELFRRQEGWLVWVVIFYLVVLALETALIVVGRKNPPAA